ncbi:MAG: hypothetical protein AB1705_19700 [Verrucomicrobiota bacterium]
MKLQNDVICTDEAMPQGGSQSAIRKNRKRGGFSLTEVLTSVSVTALTIGSIATGYVNSAQRAEWTAANAAAQSLAQQRIEQTRVAKWDTQAYPAVDEVVQENFPVLVQPLDMPVAGTPYCATNTTTIKTVSVDPPLKMIRVECTWRFMERGVFTNTVVVYRSPAQ